MRGLCLRGAPVLSVGAHRTSAHLGEELSRLRRGVRSGVRRRVRRGVRSGGLRLMRRGLRSRVWRGVLRGVRIRVRSSVRRGVRQPRLVVQSGGQRGQQG